MFLSVFLMAFLIEINIWIHGLQRRLLFSSQSIKELNRTKGGRKRKSPLFASYLLVWVEIFHLIFSSPWTEIYIRGFPDSQVFRLRLNYTTNFPVSPVGSQQILGYFNLHNCVRQFLIIKRERESSLIYINHWLCFSSEPREAFLWTYL